MPSPLFSFRSLVFFFLALTQPEFRLPVLPGVFRLPARLFWLAVLGQPFFLLWPC